MIFGQSDQYVEIFKVLGEHGLIGFILSVIAIFGLLCLIAVWTVKSIARDTIVKQSDQIRELSVSVGAIKAKGEVINTKQDTLLAEHETRLDNHEVRIVKLEDHPAGPGADMPLKHARGSRSPRRGSEEGGNQ